MVIVKLGGGLGNQMFQYAAAKAVALQNGEPLKLYTAHFNKPVKGETQRTYRLGIFPAIKEAFATTEEVKKIIPIFSFNLLNKLHREINKSILTINPAYIIEKNLSFSPIILNGRKDVFLDGYWQSENYFYSAASDIKASFNLDHLREIVPLQSTISLIDSTLSVSIHVRRGDYATNPAANAYHGLLRKDYYNRSVARMLQLGSEEPTFFIFSDDLDWCRNNLEINAKHFYVKTEHDYHDLYLMSLCRHNIIANSSFSWWAAWLNNNPGKTVIAPQNWFSGKVPNQIVPEGWIKE